MKRHTFASNFWLSPSKARKNGKAPIEATVTINGQRASFSTGKTIKPEEWDAAKQRVRGTNDQAQVLNQFLKQVKLKLYAKEVELLERGYVITAELLRDAYQDKVQSVRNRTLFEQFDEFIEAKRPLVGNELSKSTFECYERTYALLKSYLEQKFKRGDILLQELNYSFIMGFKSFLISEYHHRINTTVKHLKLLKTVVGIALANRYVAVDPFMNFKTERERVEKVYLTEEELRLIINKDFSLPRLERVRDIFIFSCFTGLAYIDVKTLNESHFEHDGQGRVWIKKERVKTGVLSRIPLLPIAKMILEKYKGGEKLLPVVDISSTDVYLKEIADLCGISKRISFHTARHTFATTVTLTNHVSLEIVAKMMGHTNTRMTMHYARIIDKCIGEEMDKLTDMFACDTMGSVGR